MHEQLSTSLIYQEAQQSAEIVASQLQRNEATINKLVKHLKTHTPKCLITSARGSSSHAATFARFLFELDLGIIGSAASPSVVTLYEKRLDMQGALFIAISQSGESPDLLLQTRSAKQAGAFVLAIVNNENSPLVELADEVLPICAGVEESVAATKTFIGSLTVILHLVSE